MVFILFVVYICIKLNNMKKVTSEQLVVGRTYYANDDQTTPLTFVKYDEDSCPCFTQPNGGYWFEQTDGLCHLGGRQIFHEIPQEPALTLQEKFEQGWEMRYKADHSRVEDLRTMKNGQICVIYESGAGSIYPDLESFENFHTITPPAPKVKRRFTAVYITDIEDCVIEADFPSWTLDAAKESNDNPTCILEHEKQGDKWVFIKAHTV